MHRWEYFNKVFGTEDTMQEQLTGIVMMKEEDGEILDIDRDSLTSAIREWLMAEVNDDGSPRSI